MAKKAERILSWLGFLFFFVFINMLKQVAVLKRNHEELSYCCWYFHDGDWYVRVYLWVHFPPQKNHRLLPEQDYILLHF